MKEIKEVLCYTSVATDRNGPYVATDRNGPYVATDRNGPYANEY